MVKLIFLFFLSYKLIFKITANPDEIRIPAEPGIRDAIVEKVIEFLEYRAAHPEQKDDMNQRALDKKETNNLAEWDQTFISSLDMPTHFRVLLAANFLNIPPLLMVAQKHLANNIKEKKAEDLKEYFKIPEGTSDDQRKP